MLWSVIMDEVGREIRSLKNKIGWLTFLVIILMIAAFPILGTVALWVAGFLLFAAIVFLIYLWLSRYSKRTFIISGVILLGLVGASIPAVNWYNTNWVHIWGDCYIGINGITYVWTGDDWIPQRYTDSLPCKGREPVAGKGRA